jgi:hypothetical protein
MFVIIFLPVVSQHIQDSPGVSREVRQGTRIPQPPCGFENRPAPRLALGQSVYNQVDFICPD